MNYSIVITTFDKRFETDLIPLISSIKSLRPEVEVILTVNGPVLSDFDQDYRGKLCQFLSGCIGVYPTMFPTFQSLAKLWNRGILTSSNDCILILNDDLKIRAENGKSFFDYFESTLETAPKTFMINSSFSHFVVDKSEVIEVGFFDERLLGLGEEDGDFFWRYHEKFDKEIPDLKIDLIDNIHSELAESGYTKGIRTASKFNRDFIKKHKYKEVLLGGYKGMFDKRVKKILQDEVQYPYEAFSLENKKDL